MFPSNKMNNIKGLFLEINFREGQTLELENNFINQNSRYKINDNVFSI